MKPRIFIGSSSEGLATARLVKEMLSDIADCQIWNEEFFKMNRSSFESLSEGAILFDFATLVATADDIQLKRDDLQSIARDNVIFEFGLYVGRLGRYRAFLLKEKGLGLPSDFFGITLPEFDNSKADGQGSLQVAVDGIRLHILEQSKLYQLSFIPSTAIAIGYFENFVLKVCRELLNAPKRFANGRDHSSFILHVVLPAELPEDFNDQVIAYLSSKGLKQMEVDTTTRKYNFYLSYSKEDSDVLKVYDIPTTLSAIKRSIEMAIPKDYVGESDWESVLKRKEMYNFCQTLTHLISKNPVTKGRVEIVFIDVDG
jgi:Predicted nucleotide-binding protein containing TIR-like domain